RLSAGGLIESTRGTGGGFRLSRPAAAISLAEIIEAVEGPIALTACVEEGRHDCALEGDCRVKPHWNAVNGAVRGALDGVSLASLSRMPA
ncbi:Rrf2 family transcriptional regulator, partial [Pseudomonas hunanensis]